jgi:hypothetical protein
MRTTTRASFGAPIVSPREVWLAGLGAVVVTREWAGKEAGPMFRTLIKEGTIVETRAVRMVGDGIENGFERANHLWHKARTIMTSTVKSAADTTVALVRELPRSLPRMPRVGVEVTVEKTPVKRRARRTAKTVKANAAGVARKTRRTVKRAAKRA